MRDFFSVVQNSFQQAFAFPINFFYLLPRYPGVASARDLAQNRAGGRLDTHMFSEQTVTDMAQMVKNSSFACHELSEPLETLQMY